MKTKAIIFGAVVAAISFVTISRTQAQSQEQPAVKIVPALQSDVIRIIYGYKTNHPTEINFLDKDGVVETDVIGGKEFEHGFTKKYNVRKLRGSAFWVELKSEELSVTYKMVPAKYGKWSAELEKITYNHPTYALN